MIHRVIRAADYIVEIGPGAGREGGEVVYQGPAANISQASGSIIRGYLEETFHLPACPARSFSDLLTVKHADSNNLKDLTVHIPLNAMVLVTGVSGSGKSSLVFDEILPALEAAFQGKACNGILEGWRKLDGVVSFRQGALYGNSRSNVATYIDVYQNIRELYENQKQQLSVRSPKKAFLLMCLAGAVKSATARERWMRVCLFWRACKAYARVVVGSDLKTKSWR